MELVLYYCTTCKAVGCRLWRNDMHTDYDTPLWCVDCAVHLYSDVVSGVDAEGYFILKNDPKGEMFRSFKVGALVPAVPRGLWDGFLRYESLNTAALKWWQARAIRSPDRFDRPSYHFLFQYPAHEVVFKEVEIDDHVIHALGHTVSDVGVRL